jgi:hypothetical protein
MPAKVKISGTYRTVPNADLFLKQNDNYNSPVIGGYVKVGGGYRQFHQGSDPVTYYFVASASKAGRGTSWKTSSGQGGADYPQISRYITAYPWYGLVKFTNDTSGVSLSSRMSVRPVVKSAYFNVQRWNDGGFGSGYGNLYVGRYTGSYTATNPNPGYCNFTYYASKNWSGSGSSAGSVNYSDNFLYRGEFVGGDPGSFPGGVAAGGIELGSNRQNLVDHVKDGNALCLSHTTNNGSSTGGLAHYGSATYAEQANYWNFWPAGYTAFGVVNIGPTLIVTLDYV